MSKRMLSAALTLILVGGVAGAEEQETAQKSRGSAIPLKVQVSFARYQGDKKVSSMPYMLSVNAGDKGMGPETAVRMGIQVPLMVRAEGNQTPTVMFKDAGTNLDCSAEALADGRFKLDFSLEQASLASGAWETSPGSPPVLRNFKSRSSLILRDGQTAQYIAATDPVSGELLKIDVTLNLVK